MSKEVLIVNLTRLGDLVQSTPLIEKIKSECPDCKISILVNEVFREITNYMNVDRIFTLNLHKLQEFLVDDNNNLDDIIVFLENSLKELKKRKFAYIINLTHSSFANYLIGYIKDKNSIVLGSYIDRFNKFRINNDWFFYLRTVFLKRITNPFNIVDIYQHSWDFVSGGKKNYFLKLKEIGDTEFDLKKPYVVIHPGASEEKKQWYVQYFAKVSEFIGKKYENYTIYLTGIEKERKLEKYFSNVISLIGKTNLQQLIYVIKNASLLITNDTGIIHIAAVYKIPIIEISTGEILYTETSPYSEGNFIFQSEVECSPCSFRIQCPKHICKEKILPDYIYPAIEKVLSGRKKDFPQGEYNLYKTCFDKGFLDYNVIKNNVFTKKHFLLSFYRYFWLVLFGYIPFSQAKVSFKNRIKDKEGNFYDDLLREFQILENFLLQIISTLRKLSSSVNSSKYSYFLEKYNLLEEEFFKEVSKFSDTKSIIDFFEGKLFLSDVKKENLISHYLSVYGKFYEGIKLGLKLLNDE